MREEIDLATRRKAVSAEAVPRTDEIPILPHILVQTPALIAVKLRKPLPDSYSPDYSPKNQHSAEGNPRYYLLIETTKLHKP